MVRLVLRLSPLAKAGVLIVIAGVALSIYGRTREVEWANRTGMLIFAAGILVYLVARVRMFRKSQKL